jgi:hypothetical protein
MHCLSSVYWLITALHVMGVSAAHHQEAECIYVANGACYTSELTVSGPGWNGVPLQPRPCIVLVIIHITSQ